MARHPKLPTWLLMVVATLVFVGVPSGITWAGYFNAIAVPAPAPPTQASNPLALTIDSLGIQDAEILPMALADGTLSPPDNPRMVGWWNGSADAGAEIGTTLLTSHKVAGGDGLFEHLVDVEPGASIVVRGETGSFSYVVQEVRVLHKDELAAESAALFALDGPHRLVLVTCEDWTGTEFNSNSVVVATPVPAPVAN